MKNISIIAYSVATLVLILQVGCASSELEREQRKEIRAQQPADTPQEIMERASLAFANAPGLTPDQKVKLGAIYSQVYTDATAIRREIGQAKSLLFSKLASVDYTDKEISSLKNRIVKLDQRRLDLMFKALDDVQEVVGHGEAAEKIYKHFEDYEIPRFRRDVD
ncbi:MAG: hypothetical protein ACXWQQ_08995 [Pseudobdellovibrio sp.]